MGEDAMRNSQHASVGGARCGSPGPWSKAVPAAAENSVPVREAPGRLSGPSRAPDRGASSEQAARTARVMET